MESFLEIVEERNSKGQIMISPYWNTKGKDLMLKGGAFYAIFDPETGMWSTNSETVINNVDAAINDYWQGKLEKNLGEVYIPQFMCKSKTHKLNEFNQWVNQLPKEFRYTPLDSSLTKDDEEVSWKDYRSKRLPYHIAKGPHPAYDKFMNTCYSPEEKAKLEWAIGSIFTGDSKKNQKFIVLYGNPGTGKSTFLNIVQQLFEGYWTIVDVDAIVSRSNQFGTAAFKDNPLVCIQHDADLSKIEKNDILNSIVSHETIFVNEKGKPQYPLKLLSMIFIGTNEVVNIQSTKQGITRRMIDVYPTGKVLDIDTYDECMEQIPFELGAIAAHCIDFYTKNKDKFLKYRPKEMIQKSNVLQNFVSDKYFELADPDNDPIGSNVLYDMYKRYIEEGGYAYKTDIRRFREAMKEYYREFKDKAYVNGQQYRNVFIGFRRELFEEEEADRAEKMIEIGKNYRFQLEKTAGNNVLDGYLADMPAQYSNNEGYPCFKWDKVKTKLSELDTTKEHYVKVPENLIVIDFDIRGENGEKNLERCLQEANKWPMTYAETSKSGGGLHLHYIYDGDVSKLSAIYSENVEIKVYKGNSALRRKLYLCNQAEIAHISSGLPQREEVKKMVSSDVIFNEKALRTFIRRNLNKEYHSATKPSMDFIFKKVEESYNAGQHYDITDLRPAILAFATNSTHNGDYCLKLAAKMHYKSEEPSEYVSNKGEIVFYDIEVFPNLFIVCWKLQGKGKKVVKMINPSAEECEKLLKFRLIGFNNRKYDNHILYAAIQGYTNIQLYNLSQRIIGNDSLNATFGEAYNLSYADIYDFTKKKQGLKKWEIELGIHHLENAYPWDQPVPKDKWDEIATYCANDVVATEAVFDENQADFKAREILAKWSGLSVNHTNRQHTTRIIFGDDKHPELVYTDLSKEFPGYKFNQFGIDPSEYAGYDPDDKDTWHTDGKSVYMGEDPSEGGKVDYVPGIWYNVALLDIESLHPHSAIELNIFGKYTKVFKEIVDLRLAIKHGELDKARSMLGGQFAEFLQDAGQAKQLAEALKIVINSVYGYTSAKFDNPFKDPRNVDNIVAKRGALFMIKLVHELRDRGIMVCHVKTDSIKIPNATPEIIDMVKKFGKKYGYTFDHEETYDRMCLVNGSTYIAHSCYGKHAGQWVAVAAQFQHPYVFKSLFSHEEITLADVSETKSSNTALYLQYGDDDKISQMKFIGKVGLFCPVKVGGGILLNKKSDANYNKLMRGWEKRKEEAEKEGKAIGPPPSEYGAATGTDGYRWEEVETIKAMHREADIDYGYFRKLCDDAVAAIEKYGDFNDFVDLGEEAESGVA